MMIGRHRIDGDLALRFAAEGASKGSALVMAFLLARWMAAEGFGAYAQTMALVAVLVPVMLLGLGFAIVRQIAGARDAAAIAAPVTTALAIASALTLPLAAVMWLSAANVAAHFSDHPDATALVRAAAVLLPVAAWQSLIYEALRARQRVRATTGLQIAEAALSLLAMIGLFLTGHLNPVGAVTAIATLKLLFFLLAGFDLVRAHELRAAGFALLPPRGIRAALALGIPFMIAGLGEALMGLADRVLVGSLAGADMAGRYIAAQTLIAILSSWGAPYWWLLYPRMAKAMSRNSVQGAVAATRRLFGNFIAWGAPLAVILALLGPQILTLALGPGYQVASVTVGILVLAVFVNQAATPWEYFLYIRGRAVFLMWGSLAWGAAAVAGITILLPAYDLPGAASAVAAARLGFALSIMFAAGRLGAGTQLLPPLVTARAAMGVAAGIASVVLAGFSGKPALANPWLLAGVFLLVYLLVNFLAARLQARWRTA
jgi:O-antigen/teichoic acid export membrane protein